MTRGCTKLDKRKKLIITAVVSGIILYLCISFYIKSTRNVIEKIIDNKDLINILLTGRNVYKENTFNFYALVSINPANNNIGITFIPPDYRIMMNDSGSDSVKISDVDFYYFDRIRYTLQKDLQLNVPFYIKVYASDVIRTIDLLEGLNLFSLDQAGCITNGKPGINYLDGYKTIKYINCAEMSSIYAKHDRILDVLLTLYSEREKRLSAINKDYISEIIKNIRTNLLPQEIYSIITLISGKGNVMSTLLPGGTNAGFYIVDEINFKTYQQDFLGPLISDTGSETAVKIKILNGTDVQGLARKLRNDLIRDGLTVTEFGTSNFGNFEHSVIISRQCDIFTANRTAEIAGIDKIYFITDTSQLTNVLIIIGEDMVSDKQK